MRVDTLLFEKRLSAKDVADKVAKDLVDRYGYYTDDKPVVREIDGGYSVSWNGPTDWATNDTYWFHEEIASMRAEFGGDTSYNEEDYKPYYDDVRGFTLEPINGYELGIYPD